MPKHTPGPWSIDGYNITAVIAEMHDKPRNFIHICDCNLGNEKPLEYLEINKANARLIASAPDLLEACKMLLKNVYDVDLNEDIRKAIKLAKQAIAKAKSK